MSGQISVESYRLGGYLIENDKGNTVYVQTDWDFPGVASTFGWSPSMAGREDCPDGCRGTDGTVKCPDCGTDAGTYIASAADYLDSCSAVVDDPGYFGDDDTEEMDTFNANLGAHIDPRDLGVK